MVKVIITIFFRRVRRQLVPDVHHRVCRGLPVQRPHRQLDLGEGPGPDEGPLLRPRHDRSRPLAHTQVCPIAKVVLPTLFLQLSGGYSWFASLKIHLTGILLAVECNKT